MIAGLVSICALVSVISTIQAFLVARETGGSFPGGMGIRYLYGDDLAGRYAYG